MTVVYCKKTKRGIDDGNIFKLRIGDVLFMAYTKADFSKEMEALKNKAMENGIFEPSEQEKQERAARNTEIESTTHKYINIMSVVPEFAEKVARLKECGIDLKFSTEQHTMYTAHTLRFKVSTENPENLKDEERSNIISGIDRFISYHNNYVNMESLYKEHWLSKGNIADILLQSFEYAAVKPNKPTGGFIPLDEVKKLMLMSGIFMYELNAHCEKDDERTENRKITV